MESRAGKTTFRTDHGASETISFFSHSLRKLIVGDHALAGAHGKQRPHQDHESMNFGTIP